MECQCWHGLIRDAGTSFHCFQSGTTFSHILVKSFSSEDAPKEELIALQRGIGHAKELQHLQRNVSAVLCSGPGVHAVLEGPLS